MLPGHTNKTMTSNAMNNKWLGAVRMTALGCLLLIATLRCEAQNLVPNPSFEEYDTCRVFNDVYYPDNGPLGWFSAGWTPDHFMSCLPYGSFNGVPLSLGAFQYPQNGDCYAGVITYHQNVEGREYFMAELMDPLIQGQTYYTSFYANAAWEGYETNPQIWVATSHIGMLFTMQPRQWENNDPVPTAGDFAHVFHPWIITDTLGWTLVSGSFVADSAYRYVMLGNHFGDAVTDTIHLGQSIQYAKAMTLIDNVCVSLSPGGCPLALGVAEPSLISVTITPNPATSELVVRGLPIGATAQICDPIGRMVWVGSTAVGSWHLNVGAWARGSYVLHLEQVGESRSFKFMLTE